MQKSKKNMNFETPSSFKELYSSSFLDSRKSWTDRKKNCEFNQRVQFEDFKDKKSIKD